MIIELEASRPCQVRPGLYRSRVTVFRVWWLWFAVAVIRGDARERTRYVWEDR